MKKYSLGAILIATLAMGMVYAWTRLTAEWNPPAVAEDRPIGEPNITTPQHLATARMIAKGDQANGKLAPDFEAVASDGGIYQLSEIVKTSPAVLIFIKDGCPCSRAADPFLRRMHSAGRGWLPFFGVIDGNVMVAQKWADQTGTVFPILADPEMKIIHAYGAENSAYVAFIGQGGRIEKLWAGYSEPMLRELAERMAVWVKPGLEPFDVSDAPAELFAGCPY